jgi:UDP-2,4-diacetamido-2,4,6-trideoxy-beta-L-altropyranose hydrolase
MKIAFRADASTSIGTGHVVRCLALAQALIRQERHAKKNAAYKGHEIHFLASSLTDGLAESIQSCGFQLPHLEQHARPLESRESVSGKLSQVG